MNHFDDNGNAVMVDVSPKGKTMRTAVARSKVRLSSQTLDVIVNNKVGKGDVLGVSRLAGIMATKKTPEIIPLAHPVVLNNVKIDFDIDSSQGLIDVKCTVKAFDRTGVEMEAMVGTTVAALTIYDMCKGMDKGITISDVALLFKDGGKSGLYEAEGTNLEQLK